MKGPLQLLKRAFCFLLDLAVTTVFPFRMAQVFILESYYGVESVPRLACRAIYTLSYTCVAHFILWLYFYTCPFILSLAQTSACGNISPRFQQLEPSYLC